MALSPLPWPNSSTASALGGALAGDIAVVAVAGVFAAAPEPMGAQDCLNYLCASKAINSSLVMV